MRKENTFKQAIKLVVAQEMLALGVSFAIFTANKVIKHYRAARQTELDRISNMEDDIDTLKHVVGDILDDSIDNVAKRCHCYTKEEPVVEEAEEAVAPATEEPVEDKPVEDKKPSKKKSVTKKPAGNRRKKAKEESEAKQVEEVPAEVVTEEDVQG